jgi:hypothetical protein
MMIRFLTLACAKAEQRVNACGAIEIGTAGLFGWWPKAGLPACRPGVSKP